MPATTPPPIDVVTLAIALCTAFLGPEAAPDGEILELISNPYSGIWNDNLWLLPGAAAAPSPAAHRMLIAM